MSDDADPVIDALVAALRPGPDHAAHLLAVAEVALGQKRRLRAAELARQAIAEGAHRPAAVARGLRLLSSLLPGYHVAMMNDARRNLAWDKALRAAIEPGMRVLEIGTGAGMLALMAARAGAAEVITCEKNPIAAAMAREIAARNGYADRIEVIGKTSYELELDRPADLLFCDIFGDRLFDFDPLSALADARRRLLKKGAPVVPARGKLRVALAHWANYARATHIDQAAGFDVAPFADFAIRTMSVDIGDPTIGLLSQPQDVFAFDFAAPEHPAFGQARARCTAAETGEANGIARWIRLELDDETTLEAAPEPGATFFSRLGFCPFAQPRTFAAGDVATIGSAYRGKTVETWLEMP